MAWFLNYLKLIFDILYCNFSSPAIQHTVSADIKVTSAQPIYQSGSKNHQKAVNCKLILGASGDAML